MISSGYYKIPNTDKGSGSRGLNDAVVDSGLRHGQQMWQLRLAKQSGDVGFDVVAGDSLVVDVAGVTVTQAFATDSATTIANFATQIAGKTDIESVEVKGYNINVTVRANKEVTLENAAVTGTSAGVAQLLLEETQELSIIPAVVVLNAEDYEALRIDEISGTDTILGYAELGTAEGETSWRLKRVTKTGNVTSVTYPEVGGVPTMDFDFSWTSRAGYTYS